ncbi:IS4 family transposase [Pseudomonas sp. 273]|uniref:IS4 family transposase n=1 Tax=Pseudomonas sp. 273 TaxID=75692 RepID=UPI0023D8A4C5|nr:IS4 family transposase [Pseudomonas sp. 273]
MFRISRFHDVLKALPRGVFDRLVAEQGADKHSKRFGSWHHLVAMVYAHLASVSSLRALETSFNSQSNHHYHLGAGPIRRSTLADANERRNAQVFALAAQYLMTGACRQLRRDGKELLYLLDSTSITLKGPGFDEWTLSNRTRTQGLKVHVLYAEQAAAPVHCSFTAANVNDVDEGKTLSIEPRATYVFDKGYYDFNWWASLDAQQARFVTRFKSNVALKVLAQREVPVQDRETILQDAEVRFSNRSPGGRRRNHYTKPLRRILVNRPGGEPPLSLATNDLTSPATEIAERYRDRWRIELFFKWIKQHLKIKRFLGRSENAVRIQILCALISYLLLSLYQRRTGARQSLWMLMVEVQATLFQRPGLEAERSRRRRERLQEINQRQGQLLIA